MNEGQEREGKVGETGGREGGRDARLKDVAGELSERGHKFIKTTLNRMGTELFSSDYNMANGNVVIGG